MQDKSTPTPNADRRAMMRKKLIDAARALFVEKGFAATSTPEIVKSAQVTRGALYHHFEDKEDLFRAVVLAEVELTALLASSSPFITNVGDESRDSTIRIPNMDDPVISAIE